MEDRTITAQLKKVDLDIGHLNITTTKEPGDYDRALTGVDFDIVIDGKNFRDTPLSKLKSITINIGDAETIATVTYTCCPYVNKKNKRK